MLYAEITKATLFAKGKKGFVTKNVKYQTSGGKSRFIPMHMFLCFIHIFCFFNQVLLEFRIAVVL